MEYLFPFGTDNFVADYLSVSLIYHTHDGTKKRVFIIPFSESSCSTDFFDTFIDYDFVFELVKAYLFDNLPNLAHYLFDDSDGDIANKKYTIRCTKYYKGV